MTPNSRRCLYWRETISEAVLTKTVEIQSHKDASGFRPFWRAFVSIGSECCWADPSTEDRFSCSHFIGTILKGRKIRFARRHDRRGNMGLDAAPNCHRVPDVRCHQPI